LKSRKYLYAFLSLFVVLALVLSGCNSSSSPKEKLQDALKKSAEVKSYGMKGSLKVQDLKLPPEVMEEEGAASALGLIQNAEVSWTGAYRLDPLLMELNLKLSISGDLAMTFQVPIIMNKEKMWIKVPNIPMLGLPEDLVGKFVEFDLNELAKEQGTEWTGVADVGQSVKFANDIYAILFKHLDEKTYLSAPSAKDAGIPDEAGVKSVVQFHLTQEQVEPFIKTVVKDIAPEIINLLSSNEDYRKLAELSQEDLDSAKKELDNLSDADLQEGIDEFKKTVKSLDVLANFGINKDGFASYTDATLKAEIEDEGQSGSGTIKIVSELTDINGDVKFEFDVPKEEDVITLDELSEYGLY